MQIAACNARHRLDERFARWLLMVHDRIRADQIVVPDEPLALQPSRHEGQALTVDGERGCHGFLGDDRRAVVITDRPGLERASCGCYNTLTRTLGTMLGKTAQGIGTSLVPISK